MMLNVNGIQRNSNHPCSVLEAFVRAKGTWVGADCYTILLCTSTFGRFVHTNDTSPALMSAVADYLSNGEPLDVQALQ